MLLRLLAWRATRFGVSKFTVATVSEVVLGIAFNVAWLRVQAPIAAPTSSAKANPSSPAGNGNGSHHEVGKQRKRLDMITRATERGGVYLYSNLLGCDGGRMCAESPRLGCVKKKRLSPIEGFSEVDFGGSSFRVHPAYLPWCIL